MVCLIRRGDAPEEIWPLPSANFGSAWIPINRGGERSDGWGWTFEVVRLNTEGHFPFVTGTGHVFDFSGNVYITHGPAGMDASVLPHEYKTAPSRYVFSRPGPADIVFMHAGPEVNLDLSPFVLEGEEVVTLKPPRFGSAYKQITTLIFANSPGWCVKEIESSKPEEMAQTAVYHSQRQLDRTLKLTLEAANPVQLLMARFSYSPKVT